MDLSIVENSKGWKNYTWSLESLRVWVKNSLLGGKLFNSSQFRNFVGRSRTDFFFFFNIWLKTFSKKKVTPVICFFLFLLKLNNVNLLFFPHYYEIQ